MTEKEYGELKIKYDTQKKINYDILEENTELKKKYEAQKSINLELVEENAKLLDYNKKLRNCANCTREGCKNEDGACIELIKYCADNDRKLWIMR